MWAILKALERKSVTAEMLPGVELWRLSAVLSEGETGEEVRQLKS